MGTTCNETKNLANELLTSGGILIGSRAFRVQSEDSDWDIAILFDYLPQRYKDIIAASNIDVHNIENYYNKLPPLGNGWLIRNYNIDILVFESQKI